MNENFNKNAKVEKFTTMVGIAVRLIVIDPLSTTFIPGGMLHHPYTCTSMHLRLD